MTGVVVVSAGLSVPSSTRLLADQLGTAVERAVSARGAAVEVEHVELRPLAHSLADSMLSGFASGDLAAAIAKVARADALVAVTPVFAAPCSGLFKTFFDVLEQGVLDGRPVLVAATAGTARHSLVLDHALRPLFAYLHAVVVPTGVFAASEDFAGSDGALTKRIERAAAELAALLPGGAETAGAERGPRRDLVEDRFAAPVDFEQLLREAGGDSIR
ncbi:MAG: NAD(P)H-dependent oxidoreductase [Nocardioidaceae bacterium]|nr:NAD(P)H-dependent oxidoreductase [Nocardioidaceae bacterium]MCL2612167.1 NAD(P)H-dependent oxidoreductase [Nocardioidaceae bacterium]